MSTPLTKQEREKLRASLRWHFNCHAAEPDKGYDSLGVQNAENIAESIVAARVAAVRDRLLGKVEALANSPDDTQWWPVVPYRDDGVNDDEVVEVHVVDADRLCALVAEERAT